MSQTSGPPHRDVLGMRSRDSVGMSDPRRHTLDTKSRSRPPKTATGIEDVIVIISRDKHNISDQTSRTVELRNTAANLPPIAMCSYAY